MRVALLLGLFAVAALVGCGSSGGASAAGRCETLSLLLTPVRTDVKPPEMGDDEFLSALKGATDGDQRADVEVLARAMADDSSATFAEGKAAAERLVDHAGATCPPKEPAWGCLTQSKFTPVGSSIDAGDSLPGVDGEGPDGPKGAATPEAAAPEAKAGERRVEAERHDDKVVFAYVTKGNLAERSATVTKGPGGWVAGPSSDCN